MHQLKFKLRKNVVSVTADIFSAHWLHEAMVRAADGQVLNTVGGSGRTKAKKNNKKNG